MLVRPPARARGRRGRKQRTKTRTTCRRTLRPRLGRVRRTQENSKLSQRHLHRQGFVDPQYVPPIARHVVNLRRYLHPPRILLDSTSMAIAPRHPMDIIRQNRFLIRIYDHRAVAPISLRLLLLPDPFQFQYRGAILHQSTISRMRRICPAHF